MRNVCDRCSLWRRQQQQTTSTACYSGSCCPLPCCQCDGRRSRFSIIRRWPIFRRRVVSCSSLCIFFPSSSPRPLGAVSPRRRAPLSYWSRLPPIHYAYTSLSYRPAAAYAFVFIAPQHNIFRHNTYNTPPSRSLVVVPRVRSFSPHRHLRSSSSRHS